MAALAALCKIYGIDRIDGIDGIGSIDPVYSINKIAIIIATRPATAIATGIGLGNGQPWVAHHYPALLMGS